MTWDTLIETSDSSIKYCHDCDRGVHYCKDKNDLAYSLTKDWCVAIDVTDEDNQTQTLLGDID